MMFNSSTRKAHGYATWSLPDGKQVEKDTLQCCHCGGHFYVTPGSGQKRGWCMNCNAPTCGNKECCECIPLMKKIENQERRNKLYEQIVGR
jgi:hypothetical protein